MKRLYVINEADGWENYGDVNYLIHGGIFVQAESETVFNIVKNVPIYDAGTDKHDFQRLYVDITDSWIDAEAVKRTCDCPDGDNLQFAIECTEYYSPANFGSDSENLQTIDEIEASLVAAGVLIAKYPTRKRSL